MVATDTRFRAIGCLTTSTRLPGTNPYTAGQVHNVTQGCNARQHIGTAMDGVSPNPYLPSHPTITSGQSRSVTHTAHAAQPENQP